MALRQDVTLPLLRSLNVEVQMMVKAAVGVERAIAVWATVWRRQVGMDREGGATTAAQQRRGVELIGWPGDCSVARKRIVAFAAGIVDPATRQLDGEDVILPVVVAAARLGVHVDAVYVKGMAFSQLSFS